MSGWGAGGGTVITPPATTPVLAPYLDFTLDNWGTWLIACADQGPLFWWQPQSGFGAARIIEQGPQINHGCFVAMPQRMIVAYGSSFGNAHDPMLVRWSTAGDFTIWNAMSTNQAGSFNLSKGNQIVAGIQAAQQALLFTDLGVWAMNYLGPPLVWGFNQIGVGCGCISRHGVCSLFGVTFWWGAGNFYILDSNGPHELPCTVWDQVFQNINRGVDANGNPYTNKCVAAPNSVFNEVMFFYPSLNATECDSYAKFSLSNGVWDYGTLQRTAWIDQSVFGPPLAADSGGFIYQHEIGYDADGQPLATLITSGWFLVSEGDPVAMIDLLLPDFKWGVRGSGLMTANLLITIMTADYPQGPIHTHGPYTVTQATKWVNTRCRGRMMRIKIESKDLGSFWRLGDFRYRGKIDGRRGD